MNCTEEELTKRNVFHLNILNPLIKIFESYMIIKKELSPDEFCLMLFAKKEEKERCENDYDLLRERFDNLEDLKVLKDLSISEQNIIADLFINIVRYESVLEAISKDFLNHLHYRNNNELYQTMVLVYTLSYRISNLFFEESIDCFVHFKIKKILSLVLYLLRSETSNLYYEKGRLIFEEDFVEQKLVLPFLEITSCLEKLRDQLKEYLRKMKKPKPKLTIPTFMNVLNHPRHPTRAPPPTPEDLSAMRFARDVPRTNYVKPSTEMRLESLRVANKLQAMNLLKDANENAPSCLKRCKVFVKSTEEEKPKATFVRKSAPTFKPVVVKHTAASTLRECARVIGNEEKEIRKLKGLLEGGLDPSAISKFEEEKRQQQKEEELLKIQEKHLLGLLTHEGAFIAKQSLLNDIKSHAESVRKEKQELYEKLEKWREDHNKQMIEIVEKCREVEQSSREAFNAMIDEKRQKAAEVSEESRQLKLQMIKQREEETQRKIKLIQEIKTLQSLRALPFKDFDPTESSGLGLFCEMSLVELKERLFWTKMKLNEEIQNRKSAIRQQRDRQKNLIKDTRRALEEYKANKQAAPSMKSELKEVSSPEIEALRKMLEERRALRYQKNNVCNSSFNK
ncbi:cilia- and flagella-associated protein 99 [Osmia lignaria lignaria]|uniref:cilia- and flagella-associated protein 99 n=1 Tax=Osmia lignaria lignaria TaxID=1437193 RepID=UPI001478A54D|nr:calponin homology domain-containing protein DDB_G0272472-like [Osmia lignaria]